MKKSLAFTLAEVLITLAIVGVVAALTIPSVISNYQERQAVSRVKKAYSVITQVWNKYQVDNGCLGKISNCFKATDNISNADFYNRFLKPFNVVKKAGFKENRTNIDWIPEYAYDIPGSKIQRHWIGIHRQGSTNDSLLFLTSDGMLFHIQIPDNNRESGFIFIDINGKKAPNRLGKDQFPIGIGALNNKKYKDRVHPFYNEDNEISNDGLCNIRNNGVCDPDVCTRTSCSPTAYVLKNNKLPPITW